MEQVHFEQFETEIRYHFKNRHFLVEALSHSSYANEKKKCRCSNERLEFLGDSVLSIVVSSYLFHQFPELPEGELTKLRASLVCEKALHVFAQEIHLGDYLLLGKGEEHTGGRMRSSILASSTKSSCCLSSGIPAAGWQHSSGRCAEALHSKLHEPCLVQFQQHFSLQPSPVPVISF